MVRWCPGRTLQFGAVALVVLCSSAARGEVIGVDEETRGKNRVCGGRVEGGLRLRGEAATLEVFIGYERRIDAFPTDRYRVRWTTIGFRVTTG